MLRLRGSDKSRASAGQRSADRAAMRSSSYRARRQRGHRQRWHPRRHRPHGGGDDPGGYGNADDDGQQLPMLAMVAAKR